MSNCDSVINNWQEDIKSFYHFLKDNIGQEITIANKDYNCLSLSLRDSNYLTRYQKCEACNKIASFLDHDILKDNDIIEIKFGKRKGEKIIFNRYDYAPFIINYEDKHKKINLLINKQINNFIIDYYQHDNIYYYKIKNKYLNLVIVSIILKTIANAKNFPTPLKFLTFTICREKISLLNFSYEIEDLKNLLQNPSFVTPTRKKKNIYLNANIVEDIIKQILVFFLFYEKFYFCHNEANINYLKINYGVNNFTFLDKEFISSIKLYILPSKFSSISMYHSQKNTLARFYHYKKEDRNFTNLVENWFIDWDGIRKKNRNIFIHGMEDFEQGKIMYYLLGKEADKFLYFRRHIGATIMYQSFDIACFLVSLMIENYFYHAIKNNKKLNNIWSNLWLEEELVDLEKDITECKNNTFDNVFIILRKYFIRADIIEYLKFNLM